MHRVQRVGLEPHSRSVRGWFTQDGALTTIRRVCAALAVVLGVVSGCGGEPSSTPPSSDPAFVSSAASPPPSGAAEPSAAPPSSPKDCLRDLGRLDEKARIDFPPPGPVEDWPEPDWTLSVAMRGAA